MAEHLLSVLKAQDGWLNQDEAVHEVETFGGPGYIKINANGNEAITSDILKAFRKLTGQSVVWTQEDRAWRWREDGDLPSRKQP